MKISVVMATKDRPHFLAECLEAIQNQDFHDFEVVIVNDGRIEIDSVVKKFSFPLRTYKNQGPPGPYPSANLAIQKAQAPFIAFCDDDDLFAPRHLSALWTTVNQQKDPENCLVYTDTAYFEGSTENIIGFLRYDFDLSWLKKTNTIAAPAILFAKNLFNAVGGFDTEIPCHADWDFYLRLAPSCSFIRIPEILTYCRHHPESNQNKSTTPQLQQSLDRLCNKHGLGKLPLKKLIDNVC
jgi:glycosyltransferase involved in cell wall biosynthesis